jgi:hypothetical protein
MSRSAGRSRLEDVVDRRRVAGRRARAAEAAPRSGPGRWPTGTGCTPGRHASVSPRRRRCVTSVRPASRDELGDGVGTDATLLRRWSAAPPEVVEPLSRPTVTAVAHSRSAGRSRRRAEQVRVVPATEPAVAGEHEQIDAALLAPARGGDGRPARCPRPPRRTSRRAWPRRAARSAASCARRRRAAAIIFIAFVIFWVDRTVATRFRRALRLGIYTRIRPEDLGEIGERASSAP